MVLDRDPRLSPAVLRPWARTDHAFVHFRSCPEHRERNLRLEGLRIKKNTLRRTQRLQVRCQHSPEHCGADVLLGSGKASAKIWNPITVEVPVVEVFRNYDEIFPCAGNGKAALREKIFTVQHVNDVAVQGHHVHLPAIGCRRLAHDREDVPPTHKFRIVYVIRQNVQIALVRPRRHPTAKCHVSVHQLIPSHILVHVSKP
mmetsp:Transcript_25773/g.67525  ORF Transcript_25773/g.67525 Transcript_25773/m.67525 type:complete len:201 (+) Transcript_25773:1903-2505(+)